MSFTKDLILGQYYEKKYIEKRNFEDYQIINDKLFKDYDIKNNLTGKTYEVKADKKTYKSGNLFIESKCNNKWSGLNATTADYWIHFVCNGESDKERYKSKYYYRIKVEKLKEIVAKHGRLYEGAGDRGRVVGYLLSEYHVENYKFEHEIN